MIASLRLDQLPGLWANLPLPAGSLVQLVDTRAGRVLAGAGAAAALVNTTIPEGRLENVRTGEAASRHAGTDGVDYLWAWNEVGDTPWVTMVQIPSAAVFGPIYEAAFLRGLLNVAFSGVPMLLLLLLWRRLAPRYGALQAAAGYWAHGDWTHRASIRGEDELGQLGLAFDHMADQLQSSEQERQTAAQALRDRSQRLEAVQAVATEVARERDLTTLLQRLIAEATRLVGAPSGVVFVWDADAQRLRCLESPGIADALLPVRSRVAGARG
jgi:HAMP domain-containing protein